jgi:hypothetical protein
MSLEDLADNSKHERNFRRLAKQLQELRNVEPRIYVASFTGTWVNYDATRRAYYYKDRGRVYLGGVIKSGVSGTSAFTLPVGYRIPGTPAVDSMYIPANAATDNAAVLFDPSGTVSPTNFGASAVATYVFLDGINFRVD